MIESRFRKLQNDELKRFSKACIGKNVIEVGGTFSENNKRFFDLSRDYVITNYYDKNCDQQEDITNLSFKDESVDALVCISVMQHVYNYEQALNEICRVLKPGGIALITNGYLFPICMEFDYYRFTPMWWLETLKNYPIQCEIKHLGNRYSTIENLLMRPYNRLGGLMGLMNKIIGVFFTILGKLKKNDDDYPLGVSLILRKSEK